MLQMRQSNFHTLQALAEPLYQKEIAEKIKPWLNRFDGISVREKTAVNMVESIVDKEVVQVLDPTLFA